MSSDRDDGGPDVSRAARATCNVSSVTFHVAPSNDHPALHGDELSPLQEVDSKANAAKLAEQIDDQGERSAALDRLSRLSPLERLALAARDDDRIGRCVPGDATLVQRVEAAAALLLLEGPEVLLEALRDAGLTVVSLRDLAEPVHTLRAEQMQQAPDDDLLAGFDDPEVSAALAAARARRDEQVLVFEEYPDEIRIHGETRPLQRKPYQHPAIERTESTEGNPADDT